MAEFLIEPLLSMVKEKASSYLLDKYKVMEGMEEQRKILERWLPAILRIIKDAEEKGASRPEVSAWLKELKAAAYEANDVFDEFKYEALRREAKKKGHHNNLGAEVMRLLVPARNPIVFRYRMGKKLLRIAQTIETLVTEMNKFGFRHLQQAQPSREWRQTDSIISDFDREIVARSRAQETKKIVGMLLDDASNMELMVLPIVGMGGMGKTTFVQLIYNDPAIERHFELRRWCCVSDDFDVGTIAGNICQTSEKNREKALKELQSLVSGKRYLVVLDDVWNRDADKWGKLKTCLKQGGKGSAVLTTTRHLKVAEIMITGLDKAHDIEKLSDEHLWEIVRSKAFNLQNANSSELDGVVGGIVRQCVGSPLAAKAFGSMLSTRTTLDEWKDVLSKSNICNEETGILPILKLSFDDLPSHMKQCFSFCAIFPKDYEIDVEVLIQLWMAHDFIPLKGDNQPEAIGSQIFKELTWRSFFQDVEITRPVRYRSERMGLCKQITCKIHDLMHDVALSVMGKECASIVDKLSFQKLLPNPTSHVFLSSNFRMEGDVATLFNDFLKKQSPRLQTIFRTRYGYGEQLFNYMPMCTSLRALHLPKYHSPCFPGHKHHLRYLDLSGNDWLKILPEGISIMYNLQMLNLSHCLKLCQLPKDMKYMASLRHLYTNGCESLTCMPPGLGQVTSLQTLTYFVVGASSGCSNIEELRDLKLGGELELSGLENVTEALVKAACLDRKEKITHLSLKWNSKGQEEEVQECHKKVLYGLKPHDGLEMLRIKSYKGTSFPSWMTDHSMLQHLTELHLIGCTMCEEFPQFCHFKELQVLYLEELDKLRSLCRYMGSPQFLVLKELRLCSLKSMERWVETEGKEDEAKFPVLEVLKIKNCPKLTSLPEAPKLKIIKLNEGKALLSIAFLRSLRQMPSLSELRLCTFDTEATLPQIDQNHESSVSELILKGCHFFFSSSPSQPTFGLWKWFEQLVCLRIEKCVVLIHWPEEVFQSLVSLNDLWIQSCNKLIGPTRVKCGEPTQTTGQVLPHLNWLDISDCESLAELFVLPPSLKIIQIRKCPRLESIWGKGDLASTSMLGQSPSPTNYHPSLQHLFIEECTSLVTIPNLPPFLKNLNIHKCDKVCFVSGQLDALEELFIVGCNKLQSLDSMGDLPSLESLLIYSCRCLATLPSGVGSHSVLRRLEIFYCPAIDLKSFKKRHKQLFDSLEYKDISVAHSSNPREGPKLKEPRSWKYAIPLCRDRLKMLLKRDPEN